MQKSTSLFNAEEILDSARARTGLDDFGDSNVRDGLDRYCSALNSEGRVGEAGAVAVVGDTVDLLANRLVMEDEIKRLPEILGETITAPLIITGMPRTGTTKLQQLIAQDNQVLSIPFWKAMSPARVQSTREQDVDPRIALAEERVRLMSEHTPEVLSAHPSQPHEPEEEAIPLRMTFEVASNGMFDYVPRYLDWLEELPQERNYQFLKRMLQYLQWQDGGGAERSWVLKTPLHLANLDVLSMVFPDATVVQCHRDPLEVVPSTMRLMEVVALTRGNTVTPADITAVYLPYWAKQAEKNVRLRSSDLGGLTVVDVQYRSIVNDMPEVLRVIYDAWDRPLSAESHAAMSAWEDRNTQHRLGRHEYTLERFGLTREDLEKTFGASCEYFDVTIGRSA